MTANGKLPTLQALQTRCSAAPQRHAAELQWLADAIVAVSNGDACDWVAHWASTRIDVWSELVVAAGQLGDQALQQLLVAQRAELADAVARQAVSITQVAAALGRVNGQLSRHVQAAIAARDLIWAAVALTTQLSPAAQLDARQVAAAALGVLQQYEASPYWLPFAPAGVAALLRCTARIAPLVAPSVTTPVFDPAAAQASTVTVAESYASWRASLPAASETARALDALLEFADDADFPQTPALVEQGRDVALLRAAQLDALASAVFAPGQMLAEQRVQTLQHELLACTTPTEIEMCIARRSLFNAHEIVWWDALATVAFAPLVAAAHHDANPSAEAHAGLVAAVTLVVDVFGSHAAWCEVLRAPPLVAVLHHSFAFVQGEPGLLPSAWGELRFAGAAAARKARALRQVGELPMHSLSAPTGDWPDGATWLAALHADVAAVLPAADDEAEGCGLVACGDALAVTDLQQMRVPTPRARDAVLR